MEITQQYREIGAALIAGVAIPEDKVAELVDLKGKPFFGSGSNIALWAAFLKVVNEIAGENKPRNGRYMRVVKRADELAEEKSELVLGRLKAEFADLTDGELAWLVSYLKLVRDITAVADEVLPAPTVSAAKPAPAADPGVTVAPPTSGPRRVTAAADLGPGDDEDGDREPDTDHGRPRDTSRRSGGTSEPVAPPKRVTGAPIDLDAIGEVPTRTVDPEPAAAEPKVEKPKSPGPRTRILTEEEIGGKGHGGDHGHGHGDAAPVDTKGILKIVFVGIGVLIVLCSGISAIFIAWLS